MKINNIVKYALREARKSEHNYKLGAVIFKHGKPISKGFNKTKRGISTHYGHWEGSLHAEIAALIRARTDVKGASIAVARLGHGLARPCPECMAALKEAGVRKVYYTTVLGVESEKIT